MRDFFNLEYLIDLLITHANVKFDPFQADFFV